MADLTITAANVVSTGYQQDGTAGATITAGQVVYKEAATGLFKLADNNSATAEARIPYGIALHASLNGQPLRVHRSGAITIGATLTAGVAYYLSGTPGGICPVADLATGMRSVLLGMATSTTVLDVAVRDSAVVL